MIQDSSQFAYFRQHYAHFFPALARLHRTTFVRQAANLWRLKERLWQDVLTQVPHDEHFAIIDSFPIPVCQFARAHRCRRFRAEAAFGKDTLVRQTFYGLRVHVRLEWPGLITRFGIAAANVHELAVLPALTETTHGTLVGDRNYWSPTVAAQLLPSGSSSASICWLPIARPNAIRIRGGVADSVGSATALIPSLANWSIAAMSSDCGRGICGIWPTACCAKS